MKKIKKKEQFETDILKTTKKQQLNKIQIKVNHV